MQQIGLSAFSNPLAQCASDRQCRYVSIRIVLQHAVDSKALTSNLRTILLFVELF